MKVIREKSNNYSLADTLISNIFISEYLPSIPGDYIKVYLYAYMHAEIDHALTNESISETLGIKIEDVFAAWSCFEDLCIIKKQYHKKKDKFNFDVIFVDLRATLYGQEEFNYDEDNSSASMNSLGDKKIVKIFSEIEKTIGKPLPSNDIQKIGRLMENPEMEPNLVSFVYSYCAANNYSTSADSVGKIVQEWLTKGITNEEEAKEYIDSIDIRKGFYTKIMKALGLHPGSITETEKEIFDKWLDVYGYSLDEILQFAKKGAGTEHKFKYVKKVIEGEYSKNKDEQTDKKASTTPRNKYYKRIRLKNEKALEKKKAEIYEKIPEILDLDEEIKALNMERFSTLLDRRKNRTSANDAIKNKLANRTKQKKTLLEKNGYTLSDLELKHECNKCKDTGMLENGSSCPCYNSNANK